MKSRSVRKYTMKYYNVAETCRIDPQSYLLTHSFTAALDQLRVVASYLTS